MIQFKTASDYLFLGPGGEEYTQQKEKTLAQMQGIVNNSLRSVTPLTKKAALLPENGDEDDDDWEDNSSDDDGDEIDGSANVYKGNSKRIKQVAPKEEPEEPVTSEEALNADSPAEITKESAADRFYNDVVQPFMKNKKQAAGKPAA